MTQLTDAKWRELQQTLRALPRDTQYTSSGFAPRKSEPGRGFCQGNAVVAQIPKSLTGATVSVCGEKEFLIDEGVHWQDGGGEVTTCAKVAALSITNSPFHWHGITKEIYIILGGKGTMLLGHDQLVPVEAGTVILIPPGVPHGLVCADVLEGIPEETAEPVSAVLIFTPGLAPPTDPEHRDEELLYQRTSTEIFRILSGPPAA